MDAESEVCSTHGTHTNAEQSLFGNPEENGLFEDLSVNYSTIVKKSLKRKSEHVA